MATEIVSTWHGGPLVGRDREITALIQALDDVVAGTPRIVEIVGEPGMGKTRLLIELADMARARGIQVLACRGPGSGHSLRADITSALDLHLAGLASELLAGIPADRRVHAVRVLVGRLGLTLPIVLTVDDIQDADDADLDLVSQFLCRPLDAAILLVLAHRPRQIPARLRRALDNTSAVCRLPLKALSAAETGLLVGTRPTRVDHQALHQASGGNPFYLKVLLHLPPSYGAGGDADVGDLSPAIHAAVVAELEVLSPPARLAAHAAAVVADPIESSLVGHVAGLSEPELLSSLDELGRRDIIRPVQGSRWYLFRHPVFGHLVYLDSDYGWRLAAHARADAALARRHAPAVTRAAHLAYGAVVGAESVGVLTEAAAAVAHRYPELAARWLLAALRLTPVGTLTVEEGSALLWRLCRAEGRSAIGADRRQILREVLRLLPEAPVCLRLIVIACHAELDRLLRQPAPARQLARTGLEAIADSSETDQVAAVGARLTLELACAYLNHRYAAQSRTHARLALAAAADCGDRAVQACATGVTALADCLAGAVQTAADQLHRAVEMLDGLLDVELAQRLDAALWIGLSHVLLDRPQAALQHLDRAIEIGVGVGDPLTSLYLLTCRAVALCSVGRLDAAADDAASAHDIAAASGSDELRAMTRALTGWLSIWNDGGPAHEVAVGSTRPGELDLFATFERGMLAEARLAAGDYAGCVAVLAVLEDPELSQVDPWSRVGWYELLTRAALLAGRYDTAEMWAGRAESVAVLLGSGGRLGLAGLARAQVLVPSAPVVAAALAQEAADALASSGLVVQAARALAIAGSALAGLGKVDRALEALTRAEDCFSAYGARRGEREVAQLRRQLGGRASRTGRAVSGVDALTGREQQVAALVTHGMTNQQIAAQLFVTVKTVEMHLSRAFTKLGVFNRAGLVREMTLAGQGDRGAR
ncbi:MAG TPA: LuxR family transcriptional regulator [Candidatus Limnocylindrales bacterium]